MPIDKIWIVVFYKQNTPKITHLILFVTASCDVLN